MWIRDRIRTEHSQRNDAASAVKSHPTPRDQLHAKSGCTVQNCCQKCKHRSTAAHRHISSPFSAQKKNTHRPLHADRGRSQTRYHLWFTHIPVSYTHLILPNLKEYHLQSGDRVHIPGIRALLEGTDEEISATLCQGGKETAVTLYLPGLTREERDIILAGCLINYYA